VDGGRESTKRIDESTAGEQHADLIAEMADYLDRKSRRLAELSANIGERVAKAG
jgi:hypothetical protein